MRNRISRVAALSALATASAIPQMTPTHSASAAGGGGPAAYHVNANIQPPATLAAPLVGQPYSADEVMEIVQTANGGNRFASRFPVQHVFRDRSGRLRVEYSPLRGPRNPVEYPPIVEITDPVAGVFYVLDVQHHVAHAFDVPKPAPRPIAVPNGRGPSAGSAGIARAPAAQAPARPANGDLGIQDIDGLAAQGFRTTSAVPVGMLGNDTPLVTTTDTWKSLELGVIVKQVRDDPAKGVTTYRLENLKRLDPDPSLFVPPLGYSVVKEAGPITINYIGP
jgi:hypothetical protein